MGENLLSLENDLFAKFVFYAAFIVWKMTMVSVVTILLRVKKQVSASDVCSMEDDAAVCCDVTIQGNEAGM